MDRKPEPPQRALSIRQPWAWLVVHGYKPVENRPWPTRHRGPLLIHAGLQLDHGGLDWLCRKFPDLASAVALPARLRRGGIVGICEVTDCVTEYPGPWFHGPYGMVLANARPIQFQPLRGRLGLFTVRQCDWRSLPLPRRALRHGWSRWCC